jgi:hypothetical protein
VNQVGVFHNLSKQEAFLTAIPLSTSKGINIFDSCKTDVRVRGAVVG